MTNSRTLVRNQEKTIHTVIKAIFFDVDGTLLSFRTHRVPDSAVEALQRVREKGVKLFIASGRRKADIAPDYEGFAVPDEFVVGYGLDYDEKYRNLPYIGVLKPSVYEK